MTAGAAGDGRAGLGMTAGAAGDGRAELGIEALELFVTVLSQSEPDVAGSDSFYDRLCEAVCRLARMRRAVIFRYDGTLRRVRAAGAHGMDVAPFADAHVTVESAPIAARALAGDEVVEIDGDLTGQVPDEYAAMVAEPARLVCAPMTAAGRAIGVILTDRAMDAPPLQDADRYLLWTLGKAAALAAVARIFANQNEAARQLEQRIDLAREIHEGVIQRLFGVSMALDGDGALPAAARLRCAAETQSALTELRQALQRPLGRAPRATGTTLTAEVHRLAGAHPELGLVLEADGTVPPALEPLAQSVLREAVRNAHKHAAPTRVAVRVRDVDGAFVLEVVNDGVGPERRAAGMGLRLAALEALQSGGVVEFGEREGGRALGDRDGGEEPGEQQGERERLWQVRLVVPHGGDG